MRCFEAMGCGALLVSDAGRYPEGMEAETMSVYQNGGDCVGQIEGCLSDWSEAKQKADRGRTKIRNLYSKERQWALFEKLLERY